MTQLLEMVRKLTDEERRELKTFVESLLARRKTVGAGKKINYEGWAGCLANVHPELSDAQFNQLILDEWFGSKWH